MTAGTVSPFSEVSVSGKPRKARTKLTLKDKADALDKKITKLRVRITKMEQLMHVLTQRRASLVAEARAALAEVEQAKP